MRSAGAAAKEAGDVRHAKESLTALIERREEMNAEVDEEVARTQDAYDPDLMELNQEEVKPRKSDIDVGRVVLVWLPYTVDSSGMAERAF